MGKRGAICMAVLMGLASLGLLLSALRQANVLPPLDAESSWPAGSKVVGGSFCFEEHRAGSWTPIRLGRADGRVAVKGQSASGAWYFPANAGPIRVLIGCNQEGP